MKTKKLNKAQLTGLIKEELAKLKKKRNTNEQTAAGFPYGGLTFEYDFFEEVDRGTVGDAWVGGVAYFQCKEIPNLALGFGANGYLTGGDTDLDDIDDYPSQIVIDGKYIETPSVR